MADLDGDGLLGFEEFSSILAESDRDQARVLFQTLDADKNGTLDKKEVKAYIKLKMEEDVREKKLKTQVYL